MGRWSGVVFARAFSRDQANAVTLATFRTTRASGRDGCSTAPPKRHSSGSSVGRADAGHPVAAAAAAVPGGNNLDNALTSFVSFGDQVTFGASRAVRHKIGLAGAVDECSGAYNNQAVTAASMVFMLADGEGEALAAKSLASMSDEGRLIAGPGGSAFRDVGRIIDQYGGTAEQWAKMSSRKFVDGAGRSFETHWVENLITGARTEFKTKLLQGLGYYG